MKKTRLFSIVLLLIVGLFSNGSLAQDYTQWHLPEGAKMRLGKGKINDVKFSPDGDLLAVGTHIGVWLYDAQTGAEMALLNDKPKNVRTIAFSPDGKTLATSAKGETLMVLWDVIDIGRKTGLLAAQMTETGAVAFSPDGKTLVSGHKDGAIYSWDATTGVQLSTFTGNADSVTALAFSVDGRIIASGSIEGSIQLWDPSTYAPIGDVRIGHASRINALTFSPDSGTLFSGSFDGTILVWDWETLNKANER